MLPIARGQTWLSQALPASTVPNTGRNLSKSSYRGLDEEEARDNAVREVDVVDLVYNTYRFLICHGRLSRCKQS